MNDADRLEEIEKRGWHITDAEAGGWLISKAKEQDREIERITGLYNKARDEISRAERYRFVAEQNRKKAQAVLAEVKGEKA